MTLFLVLAAALAVVTYFSLRKAQMLREMPSESANFFLGNIIEMLSPTAHLVALRWRRRHGPVYQAWASIFKRLVFICDPDMIQHITVKLNARKDDHYELYSPFLGTDALFTCLDTGRWRMQRRQLVHAFAPERIKQQHPTIAKYTRQLIVRLDAAVAANRPVDIDKEMLLLGMDIIGETLMGHELQALKNGDSPVLQRLKYILIHLPPFAAVPAPLRWLFPSYRRMMQMSKELQAELAEVINSRRPEILSNWEASRNKTLFELLLTAVDEHGELHPIDVVISNVFTFLVAGHDTTAHTLAYAFYELARNPTAYQKLHEQVDAVLQDDVPPADLLPAMPFVKMVVKETLRMHPTGRGTVRMLDEPLEMKGYRIPANTTLPIMNYTVHYDEELWPEPESFRPERFEQPLKHPCAFMPFSYGPRNCIGKGFGMFEAQIVLAALAKRYDWTLAPGYKLQDFAGAFVTPANGIHVCLRHKPTAVAAS